MVSRRPLPPPPPRPIKPLPRDLPQPPSQASPTRSEISPRLSETFKKRRSGIWAIGIAVIVVAGVYIGAQYKETRQVQERFSVKDDPADTETVSVKGQEKTIGATGESGGMGSTPRGISYNQRQISVLEDRRGVLMKQKFDLERKLERVREKKKREEEVEGRRVLGEK